MCVRVYAIVFLVLLMSLGAVVNMPSSVPPTTCNRPHVVPQRGGPPGAGVGDPPLPIPPNAIKSTEDMVKALKLLQSVMTAEDFSR